MTVKEYAKATGMSESSVYEWKTNVKLKLEESLKKTNFIDEVILASFRCIFSEVATNYKMV